MAEQREGGADRRATVVINGSAGDGDVAAARAAFDALRAAGKVVIRETDSAGVAAAVRTAWSLGVTEIVVVGGDGSIQRSAREVAGNGVVLVPAPGGTLNHFARRHGIETLEDAARLVGRGRIADVPLGVADDLLFLNTLTIGAYSSVLETRERLQNTVGKWTAAVLGFARALLRMPRRRFIIETETRTLERRTALVWIGLGRGSWPLSHRIRREVPDSAFEVVVLRDLGRLAAAAWLARLLAGAFGHGDPADDPAIERFQARSLVIRSEDGGELAATVDGDPITFASPLFVSVVDDALRIRVRA